LPTGGEVWGEHWQVKFLLNLNNTVGRAERKDRVIPPGGSKSLKKGQTREKDGGAG